MTLLKKSMTKDRSGLYKEERQWGADITGLAEIKHGSHRLMENAGSNREKQNEVFIYSSIQMCIST